MTARATIVGATFVALLAGGCGPWFYSVTTPPLLEVDLWERPPELGQLCLDLNLFVISVLTGGTENGACNHYPHAGRCRTARETCI